MYSYSDLNDFQVFFRYSASHYLHVCIFVFSDMRSSVIRLVQHFFDESDLAGPVFSLAHYDFQ